ncbi:WhiB family transcriptional regulator, partial [Streptomyces sp. NPDC005953]|uniref:WhiB family transcriptional regulator n=1 Tax=Streptomyces sp. NPDC005953 TaxID=3156719 RepID=UPI0033E5DB53
MSGPAVSVAGGAYDWHTDAACQETDPELFYRSHGQVSQARRICLPCPVRLLCL